MYEHRVAYAYTDGSVEGFKGFGSTKKKAEGDAIDQIAKKILIVRETRPDEPPYHKSRLVTSPSRLKPEQVESVKADWRAGVRY